MFRVFSSCSIYRSNTNQYCMWIVELTVLKIEELKMLAWFLFKRHKYILI